MTLLEDVPSARWPRVPSEEYRIERGKIGIPIFPLDFFSGRLQGDIRIQSEIRMLSEGAGVAVGQGVGVIDGKGRFTPGTGLSIGLGIT